MYLLDTNVISELRKTGDGKADPAVVAWVSRIDAAEMFISVLTLMELEIGILRVERRDAQQGARLRDWFENRVCPEFKDRTLGSQPEIRARCADRRDGAGAWPTRCDLEHR